MRTIRLKDVKAAVREAGIDLSDVSADAGQWMIVSDQDDDECPVFLEIEVFLKNSKDKRFRDPMSRGDHPRPATETRQIPLVVADAE